jgi:hypothetical protein
MEGAKGLAYSLIKKELRLGTNRAKSGKQNNHYRDIIEPK